MGDHGHVLITSLGTKPSEITYRLNGRIAKGRIAPLALLDLLPDDGDQPDSLIVLVTEEARLDPLPELRSEAERRKIDVTEIDTPFDNGPKAIGSLLAKVAPAVGHRDVSLDLTAGPRHLAFLGHKRNTDL